MSPNDVVDPCVDCEEITCTGCPVYKKLVEDEIVVTPEDVVDKLVASGFIGMEGCECQTCVAVREKLKERKDDMCNECGCSDQVPDPTDEDLARYEAQEASLIQVLDEEPDFDGYIDHEDQAFSKMLQRRGIECHPPCLFHIEYGEDRTFTVARVAFIGGELDGKAFYGCSKMNEKDVYNYTKGTRLALSRAADAVQFYFEQKALDCGELDDMGLEWQEDPEQCTCSWCQNFSEGCPGDVCGKDQDEECFGNNSCEKDDDLPF